MSDRAQEILEQNIVAGDLDDDVATFTVAGLIGDIEAALATAALTALEAAGMRVVPAGKRVRHVKRGSTYDVLGVAEAQVSKFGRSDFPATARMICDGDRLVVYRGEDGKLWCRFEDEFNDGRFEQIAAQEDSTSE